MSLVQIIQMLMSILAFIVGLFTPKTGVKQVAFITDADCSRVEWKVPATVSNGMYSGTAEVVCGFEGAAGGGIPALREHMIRTIPSSAQTGQTMVSDYQGVAAFSWITQLEMTDGVVNGTTFIASNGSTYLRNVFESSEVKGTGNAQYLKSLYASMEVSEKADGTYQLRASQAMQVKKPFLISNSKFLSSLKAEAEKALLERAMSSVQDMASHL